MTKKPSLQQLEKEIREGEILLNSEDVADILDANFAGDIENAITNGAIVFKARSSRIDPKLGNLYLNGVLECKFSDKKLAREFPRSVDAHIIVDGKNPPMIIKGGYSLE